MYDSLGTPLPLQTKKQIASLLRTKEKLIRIKFANVQVSVLNSSQYIVFLPILIVRMSCIMPLQKQHNYSDCGLFAIANAIALCMEQKPECLSYDYSIMRRHFAGCLEDKLMRHFPANPRNVRKMTRRSEEVAVFCTCRMPEDEEKMIRCDSCEEWYHERCTPHIPEEVWINKDYQWNCNDCQ